MSSTEWISLGEGSNLALCEYHKDLAMIRSSIVREVLL